MVVEKRDGVEFLLQVSDINLFVNGWQNMMCFVGGLALSYWPLKKIGMSNS
jgi:hypothetical protein